MPRVSVIMPAYNHERFVAEAIESVLLQSFEDWELCVTDDSSTDRTAEIVSSIKDERVRFNRFTRNRGVSAALNDAISRSQGEYIAVLNSDDIFLPDKLRSQVEVLDSDPKIGAIFGLPEFFDDNGCILRAEDTFYGTVFDVENRPQSKWLHEFFFRGNCLCHPTVMLRRRCHEQVGLYDERLAQVHDLDLWIRIIQKYPIRVEREVTTLFRIIGGNSNASYPSLGVITRTHWESSRILRNYLDLGDDAFDEIFCQELAGLGIDRGLSKNKKLGLIAVRGGPLAAQHFGLDVLFNALPAQAADTRGADGELGRELIRLTGAMDFYGFGSASRYRRDYEELEERTASDSPRVGVTPFENEPSKRARGGWLGQWVKKVRLGQ